MRSLRGLTSSKGRSPRDEVNRFDNFLGFLVGPYRGYPESTPNI